MTFPADQSAVHDEKAGAAPRPDDTAAGAPEPTATGPGGAAGPGGSAGQETAGQEGDAEHDDSPQEATPGQDDATGSGHGGSDPGGAAEQGGNAGHDDAATGADEQAGDPDRGEAQPAQPPRQVHPGRREDDGEAEGMARQIDLARVLTELRDQVEEVRFVLDVPGAEDARAAQLEIKNQLDDYVLPKIRGKSAPMLVVLGGSTGAGKSTLVNTIVGSRVSATGVLRPTTSSPILVCHPDHADWFLKGPLLPGMGRVPGPAPDAIAGDQLVIIGSDQLPEGLALLDSPDFDSVFEDHYEFATKLMAAADLWLCVTTAARYADAQVWQMLQRAKEQGATLGVVLSRVPQGAGSEVVDHFAEMLEEHGVGDARRFTIPETRIEQSRLPEEAAEEIRAWLMGLAESVDRRGAVIRDTFGGVLDSFRTRVPELAKQVEAQVEVRTMLRGEVEASYATALAELDEATRNGSLLRGEVLARWQDFAGTGDLVRALHVQRGRPSRKSNRRRRTPARVRALKSALRSSLESLILANAEHAAEQVLVRWRANPAGGQVLAGPAAALGSVSPELSRRVTRAVSSWQDHVLELIRTEGVTKRSVAKLVSFDEEALSLVLMIGLLGYGTTDVAVEGGTSAVPQRLLKALFGAESLRGMGAKARADLRSRIGMLFDEEAIRFGQALDSAGIPDETAAVMLYQATYNLEVAR